MGFELAIGVKALTTRFAPAQDLAVDGELVCLHQSKRVERIITDRAIPVLAFPASVGKTNLDFFNVDLKLVRKVSATKFLNHFACLLFLVPSFVSQTLLFLFLSFLYIGFF